MIPHSGSLILYLRMNSVRGSSTRLSSSEGSSMAKPIPKIGEGIALALPCAPIIYAIA